MSVSLAHMLTVIRTIAQRTSQSTPKGGLRRLGGPADTLPSYSEASPVQRHTSWDPLGVREWAGGGASSQTTAPRDHLSPRDRFVPRDSWTGAAAGASRPPSKDNAPLFLVSGRCG